VVDDVNTERIVVFVVGETNAGCPDGSRESQVQDQRRIGLLLLFADVADAKAEDVAVIQDSPYEPSRRAAVFPVIDGRSCR
jgi:hypothetical protein